MPAPAARPRLKPTLIAEALTAPRTMETVSRTSIMTSWYSSIGSSERSATWRRGVTSTRHDQEVRRGERVAVQADERVRHADEDQELTEASLGDARHLAEHAEVWLRPDDVVDTPRGPEGGLHCGECRT